MTDSLDALKEPDMRKAFQDWRQLYYGWLNVFPVNLFYQPEQDPQNNLLRFCVRQGNTDCVQKLLKYVDPSLPHNEAIKLACELNRFTIMSLLLQDGRANPYSVSVNSSGNYIEYNCLKRACEKGFDGIVALLLGDGRLNPNDGLNVACTKGFEKIVGLLLNDPRTKYNSYDFKEAIQSNNTSIVKLFLKDYRFDPEYLKIVANDTMFSENISPEIQDLILLEPRQAKEKTVQYIIQKLKKPTVIVNIDYTGLSTNELLQKLRDIGTEQPNIVLQELTNAFMIKNIDPIFYSIIVYVLQQGANGDLIAKNFNLTNADFLYTVLNLSGIRLFPFVQQSFRLFAIRLSNTIFKHQERLYLVKQFVDVYKNIPVLVEKYQQRETIINDFLQSILSNQKYIQSKKEDLLLLFYWDIIDKLQLWTQSSYALLENTEKSISLTSFYIFLEKLKHTEISGSAQQLLYEVLDDKILNDTAFTFTGLTNLFLLGKRYVIQREVTISPETKCSYDRKRIDVQKDTQEIFQSLNLLWPDKGVILFQKPKESSNIAIPFPVQEYYDADGEEFVYKTVRIKKSVIDTIKANTTKIIYLDVAVPGHIFGCLLYMNSQTIVTLDTAITDDTLNFTEAFQYLSKFIFGQSGPIYHFPTTYDVNVQRNDNKFFAFGQCLDWNILLATEFVKTFPQIPTDNLLRKAYNFYKDFDKTFSFETEQNYKNYKAALNALGIQGGFH